MNKKELIQTQPSGGSSLPNLSEQLNDLIIRSIQDIKGKNIVKLDLRKLDEAPADFFIICEGTSSTQVKGISDNVEKKLREELGIKPGHVEGTQYASWVLMDYFTTMVHIFLPQVRHYYDLEGLWSDADFTEYVDL